MPANSRTDAPTSPFADLKAEAPAAAKRPVAIEQHGITRVDPYAWLKDDNWQQVLREPEVLRPEIRAHLEAENTYYAAATDDLDALRARLFEEMRGRIKEDDSTVPQAHGEYLYSARYRAGGDYPVYVRSDRAGHNEQILFDGDSESGDADFFRIGSVSHSPDHALIAHAIDRLGSEYYDVRIRNIATGEEYDETVGSTSGYVSWASDSKSFFYVERDENQRPRRVRRHVLGTDPADDELIYEEPDKSYFLGISKTQSDRYITITSEKSNSTEVRFLAADAAPGTEPTLIAPRELDEEYSVEHHGDHFYIHTNRGDALDFKIMRTPVATPGREHWEEWLAHKPGTYVLDFLPL
ncbi:MAG: S9 family peptidase, partial [Pseudomonadota bacterium]